MPAGALGTEDEVLLAGLCLEASDPFLKLPPEGRGAERAERIEAVIIQR